MSVDTLSAAFSALPPAAKAGFFARVIHETTIDARTDAYVAGTEEADGSKLRVFNEFVHRVSGYIMCVLDGREGDGQDASVMAMIVDFYGRGSAARRRGLAQWLDRQR